MSMSIRFRFCSGSPLDEVERPPCAEVSLPVCDPRSGVWRPGLWRSGLWRSGVFRGPACTHHMSDEEFREAFAKASLASSTRARVSFLRVFCGRLRQGPSQSCRDGYSVCSCQRADRFRVAHLDHGDLFSAYQRWHRQACRREVRNHHIPRPTAIFRVGDHQYPQNRRVADRVRRGGDQNRAALANRPADVRKRRPYHIPNNRPAVSSGQYRGLQVCERYAVGFRIPFGEGSKRVLRHRGAARRSRRSLAQNDAARFDRVGDLIPFSQLS
jgi:hypothetical protein